LPHVLVQVLVSTNAVGAIQHWHLTSGKCLNTLEEENNQIFALDYRPDGLAFATGGKDATIRIYDEATKTLTQSLKAGLGYGSRTTTGHSNRVFSVKFHPEEEHLVASGGWDNTVQIWDTRAGHAVRSIYGPHLCGDSLDLVVQGKATSLLTGSWRPGSPLEIWDFESGKLVQEVEWSSSILGDQACLLYAAQFSKNDGQGRYIAAGGSGANEARIFDRQATSSSGASGGAESTALVGTVTGMSRGVFSTDWCPVADKVAVGTGDGTIRILAVVDRKSGAADDTGPAGSLIDVAVEAAGPITEKAGE